MPYIVILVDGENARVIGQAQTPAKADDLIVEDFEANARRSPSQYTVAGPTVDPKIARRVESVEVDNA